MSFDEAGTENDLSAAFDGHGRWKEMPELWNEITPQRIVAGKRLAEHMLAAIDSLPPAQRAVIVLKVQQGLEPGEICKTLGFTDGNMRVLHASCTVVVARHAGGTGMMPRCVAMMTFTRSCGASRNKHGPEWSFCCEVLKGSIRRC